MLLLNPGATFAQEGAEPTTTPDQPIQIVALDPGHGGFESGAVHRGANGRIDLLEKDANLKIALLAEQLLLDQGYGVVLTRREDSQVNVPRIDRNGDGAIDNDDDLQARVDIANEAGASLLFSIHNNGSTDSRVRGTSAWYAEAHPRGAESRFLAALVQHSLIDRLREAGYADAVDAGFHDDPPLRKPFGHLFLVGPQTPRVARVSVMPGVVGESLYVSNDREASMLQDDTMLQAIAQAYADAAIEFLAPRRPERSEGPPGSSPCRYTVDASGRSFVAPLPRMTGKCGSAVP